jgi:hypothetical protein
LHEVSQAHVTAKAMSTQFPVMLLESGSTQLRVVFGQKVGGHSVGVRVGLEAIEGKPGKLTEAKPPGITAVSECMITQARNEVASAQQAAK